MLTVEGESFARKQVNRDRISRKSVKDKNVKVLTLATSGFLLQRQSCVSMHYLNRSLGIPQISEKGMVSLRKSNHIRIELVKSENIAGSGIGRKCAHSQSHHANTNWPGSMIAEQKIDPAIGAKITGRFSSEFGIQILPSVIGQAITKIEIIISRERTTNYGENTVKIARTCNRII